MSEVTGIPDQLAIEPQRPWAVKRGVRATNAGRLVVFATLAVGITLVTPLANADGWAVAFLLVNLVWTIATAARLGAKKRRDAIVRVVVSSLAFLAFVPWLSIFVSTALKGYKGLYPGYLFNDMRITSYDDELTFGGVGHAVVGSLIMVAIATILTLPLGILSGIYLTEIRTTHVPCSIHRAVNGRCSIGGGWAVHFCNRRAVHGKVFRPRWWHRSCGADAANRFSNRRGGVEAGAR